MSNGVPFEMPGVYVPGPDIIVDPAHYDPAVITTNHFVNPNFEGTNGSVAVRTNLVKKTRPTTTDFDGWAITGYGTGGAGSFSFVPDVGFNGLPAMVVTWTTAATAGGSTMYCARPTFDDIPVVPATVITASVYMKSNQALTGVVSGLFTFYNSSGVSVGSTLTAGRSVAANEEIRLTLTVTVPANAARLHMAPRITNLAGTTAGLTVTVSAPLVEVTSYVQPFFDGSTPAAGDFTYVWAGTANASSSAQWAPRAASTVFTTGQTVAYLAADAEYGKVWRQTITTTAAYGINADIPGLTAGQPYTILMRVRASKELQVKPRIYSVQVAGPNYVLPANEWVDVRATITPNSYNQFSGLVGPGLIGHIPGDTIDVAYLFVTEGTYTGPFFDGSTPPEFETVYAWTGTPDASKSTRTYQHFNPDVYGPGPDLYIPGPMVTVYPQPLSVGSRTAEAYLPSYTTSASKRGS